MNNTLSVVSIGQMQSGISKRRHSRQVVIHSLPVALTDPLALMSLCSVLPNHCCWDRDPSRGTVSMDKAVPREGGRARGEKTTRALTSGCQCLEKQDNGGHRDSVGKQPTAPAWTGHSG